MKDKKVFICYSVPLMKQLQKEGCRYEVIGLNPDNKKTFYVYVIDQKIKNILEMWKQGAYVK